MATERGNSIPAKLRYRTPSSYLPDSVVSFEVHVSLYQECVLLAAVWFKGLTVFHVLVTKTWRSDNLDPGVVRGRSPPIG